MITKAVNDGRTSSKRLVQRLALGELGDVDLQDQQGVDDGEDAVGQGEHPRGIVGALQHGLGLRIAFRRPADLDLWLVTHGNLPVPPKPAERL